MCELLGVSSSRPVTATLSLTELAAHGGRTGPHKDGWGVAYYLGHDVRLLKDAEPAATSELVEFIEGHRFRSQLVIAHVRRRSRGRVSYANTHPFVREIGGRVHVFAHNGFLAGVERLESSCTPRYRPVGETDSELAACALFGRQARLWDGGAPPDVAARHQVVAAFAAEARELGPTNFVYCDGEVLFAHSHVRPQRPGSEPEAPGLQLLCRGCAPSSVRHGGGVRLEHTAEMDQSVALVASVPLTGEGWTPIPAGTVLALRAGQVLEPTARAVEGGPQEKLSR